MFGESLPARERGLKLVGGLSALLGAMVAPRTGAWIETPNIGNLGMTL